MAYAVCKYVLHHHHKTKKTNAHFDLRIQIPNRSLLASFAIPKMTIPKNKGDKVLLVRTNDHGNYWLYIDKLDIPAGHPGAGRIDMLDHGMFLINGWGPEHITFTAPNKGKYFKGTYTLIKFKGSKSGDRANLWIFMKATKDIKI